MQLLRLKLFYTLDVLCPNTDLSVGMQTAAKAPLCLCR